MIYYHYVITVYHPAKHKVIGRNSGIQRVNNDINPIESHERLVHDFSARMGSIPGIPEGAYFIISPYTVLSQDDTVQAMVSVPGPLDNTHVEAMNAWRALIDKAGSVEDANMLIKRNIMEAKPGDFFFAEDGGIMYMAGHDPEHNVYNIRPMGDY